MNILDAFNLMFGNEIPSTNEQEKTYNIFEQKLTNYLKENEKNDNRRRNNILDSTVQRSKEEQNNS